MSFAFAARLTLALASASISFAQDAPWPTETWAVSTAAAQGLDPEPLEALEQRARAGDYGYVDRLLVIRNGHVVLDAEYEHDYAALMKDRARDASQALTCGGKPGVYNYYDSEQHPFYQGSALHSLQSVTKSVSSTVIGIAIGRGEIESVQARLAPFFEDYDLSQVDPRFSAITLEELLTMRSGIAWHEEGLDESNTTLQLERSPDWIQFTLDQPMDADPGAKWEYNSGGSHLMSGIIRMATDRFIDDYAREHLFEPIGIREFHWKKTPKGYPDTEGGLYLRSEGLARFGYLFLRGGRWGDAQVVPADWVSAATARRVDDTRGDGRGYGYQWWRLDREEMDVWAALGFGGQFLLVLPELDIVAVANGWNLFGPHDSVLDGLLQAVLEAAR